MNRERSPVRHGGPSSSSTAAAPAEVPEVPEYRPGRNTRRVDPMTTETQTSQGVVRETTFEEPDGTMYTEYLFPDGHVEIDYW